jgi:hypothetical protein
VANVVGEHYTQMPLTEDQHPVGEFGSQGADESFGEAVPPWATRGNLDHLDAHIGEHSVERRCELSGSISEEEPELGEAIAKTHHQVADLLRGPSAGTNES